MPVSGREAATLAGLQRAHQALAASTRHKRHDALARAWVRGSLGRERLTRDCPGSRTSEARAGPQPSARPSLPVVRERSKQGLARGEARPPGAWRSGLPPPGHPVRDCFPAAKYRVRCCWRPTWRPRSLPAWPQGGACACLFRACARPPGRASRKFLSASRTAAATTLPLTCGAAKGCNATPRRAPPRSKWAAASCARCMLATTRRTCTRHLD